MSRVQITSQVAYAGLLFRRLHVDRPSHQVSKAHQVHKLSVPQMIGIASSATTPCVSDGRSTPNLLRADMRACSSDGAFLVERARQHRDMRVKGTAELRQKVLDLKVKLQEDRERMQKEFEEKVCFHCQRLRLRDARFTFDFFIIIEIAAHLS